MTTGIKQPPAFSKTTGSRRIISASRRTDLPAFYSEWFMGRIAAGFCRYPNPLYPQQVYTVDLRPEAVQGIVFWTRFAGPLLAHVSRLRDAGYAFYVQHTLLGYPRALDRRGPALEQAISAFQRLSTSIGPRAIVWRYDPIVLSAATDVAWHRAQFRRIGDALQGTTKRLVLSIVDPYSKTLRHLRQESINVEFGLPAYQDLLHWMVEQARGRGIEEIQCCAEEGLNIPGLAPGSCIDEALLATLGGAPTKPGTTSRKPLRPGCRCAPSVDIGVPDTCGFGCAYCYAVADHDRARARLLRHDPSADSMLE